MKKHLTSLPEARVSLLLSNVFAEDTDTTNRIMYLDIHIDTCSSNIEDLVRYSPERSKISCFANAALFVKGVVLTFNLMSKSPQKERDSEN